MNKIMTENWNSVVKDGDLVIHGGDFAEPRCKDPVPYLEKLNGRIVLIRGNHDKRVSCDHFMWTDRLQIKVGEFKCVVNHRPVYPPELKREDLFHDHDNTLRDIGDFDFVISGHVHEKYSWIGKSINIGVDVNQFKPMHIDELERKLKLRRDQGFQPGFVKFLKEGR
jgi:calcineurin-like phosphoesterase family protein